MKKAFRAAAIAAILLFALTFIENAKIKSASAHLLFSSSVSVGGNESREVTLKSGDRIAIGSYLGEPIIWRVIETGNKTLLMSENVLCFRAFDPSEDGIGSSDYLASPLRAWLNSESGFLNPENFSEFNLSLISPDKNGDLIFLPSKDMLKNISAADRRRSPTEQCIKNDTSRYLTLRKYCWYWTSSPVSTNQSSVTAVTTTGGFYKTLAADELCGVCPAMYLRKSVCVGGRWRKMREKLKEFQNSPRSIIAAFSAAVLFFCTVFTRLILKTDDGHFLGILHRNGFTVTSWLHERYTTVSGRIVGEWLMINFLRLPLIFWKLFIAALIIYIMYFLCRLSDFLGEKTDIRQRYIFACSVPLAVFLPCLNPSVFWFAGSFTFLVPFAALLITVTPLTFEVFSGRVNPMAYVAAAIASVVATSQEQSCAAVLALQAILLIFSAYQRRLRFRQFIPLLPSAVSAAVLVLSPGLRGRGAMEAASGFERFSKMNIFERLLCGFSNYFAFSFFFSLITAAVFLVLLGASVYEAFGGSRKIKKIISVFAIFAPVLYVGVNAAYIIIRRTTPDKGFEKMFKNGNYLSLELAVIALCFVFLFSLFILIAALIKKNKKLGFTVGVLFSAAVCCAAVLGFSSSVYASGQRVFYYTEMFTLIACTAMYSSLSESKAKKFAGYAVPTAAFIFYIINCFTYTFLEIPIMG